MKNILTCIFSVLLILSAPSCAESPAEDLLDMAETGMEVSPEKSLAVLESIDRASLNSRRLKARFALLYSMALNKNYIDIANDSIIAPAVRYYRRHGTPDERMLAYYYNGIVYSFSGDSEQEMQNYLKAERFAEKAENKRAAGRLYKAKMAVYNKVYDYKAAIEEGKTAARYYLEASDTARYLSAINDIVAVSDLADDSLTRMENLKILENHRNLLTSRQRSNLYSIRILFAIDSGSISQVDSLVSEYLENIKDSSIIQWSTLSYAYLSTEKYKEAGSSLEHYARFSGKKELDYYWMYASLQEALSNPAEALSAYKTYMKMLDEEKVSIFQNDTKFLEERRDAKIRSDNYILYIIT